MEWFVVILFGFNIFQMLFWSRIVDRLENKLMSRDFHNYIDSKRPVKAKNDFKIIRDEIDLNSEIQPF